MKRLLVGFEWALLLLALASFTITETYQLYVTIGLLLLAASFVLRAARTRWLAASAESKKFLPRTGLEIPWALGIVSALIAVWAAYDHPLAWLQFYRFLAACVLFYAIVDSSPALQRWLAGGFLLAATGLAGYWPWHNDFALNPGKLSVINRLGLFMDERLPAIPGPDIHSNVAAGLLVVALPFGMAFTWDAWRRRHKLLAALAGLCTLLILAGLFMTSSRGAWLALLGAMVLAGLLLLQRRWFFSPPRALVFWVVLAVAAGLVVASVFFTGNFDRLIGQVPDPGGGIQSRTQMWLQGLGLVRDYVFTGCGLMSFWMVNSVYALLIHAPFIAHAHNTFLEVWIEQGLLGFLGLALAGLTVLVWAWRAFIRQYIPVFGWAGLFSLVAAAIHGMVDVVFYVERTLPVVGLLFGFCWLTNQRIFQAEPGAPALPGRKPSRVSAWMLRLGFITALVVTVFILRKPIVSAWYANLGAVQQSRLELTRYNPDRSGGFMLDKVRQDSIADLIPALDHFARALAVNPTNRTALQRQAQIAMSLKEYAPALDVTKRLWQAGYRDNVTRLLYGDALVANGYIEEAVPVVQGLTWAEPRLLGQAWARYWEPRDYRRAIDAWSTVLLVNPQASQATDIESWIKTAQSKLK